MNLSYWEQQTWFANIDYAIIGSGIVGLNCALELRNMHPNAKIVVFEKGMLPSGASTKNAGFACFGSISEILEDLKTHTEAEVLQLVKKRIAGLKTLRELLGDTAIEYKELGGYELFSANDMTLFEHCESKIPYINEILFPIVKGNVFKVVANKFGFQGVHQQLIYNCFEGQINTGKMMQALLKKATKNKILILNNAEVTSLKSQDTKVLFEVNKTNISAKKVCIATNGFARQFLKEDVQPARAQVVITKPIKNLAICGTFHLDCGYYYFRNIEGRILLGGGRNLDLKTEQTTKTGFTPIVQERLEHLLKNTILPGVDFEIDTRWSGIMGVGNKKTPILKEVEPHVFCGVRLGGMGIAIGSTIGKQLAKLTQ